MESEQIEAILRWYKSEKKRINIRLLEKDIELLKQISEIDNYYTDKVIEIFEDCAIGYYGSNNDKLEEDVENWINEHKED